MSQNQSNALSSRVIDVSRLLSRLHRRTPTGIDRVQLAYAAHYLQRAEREDVRFLLTTPLNTGLLSTAMVQHLVRTARERWCGSVDRPEAHAALARLREILNTPIGAETVHERIRVAEPVLAISESATQALLASAYLQGAVDGLVGAKLAALRRTSSWCLHVSHINLHRPGRLRWLHGTRLRRMFLVHDLIPISHPEYFLPGEGQRHQQRLETIAGLADVVIFNSKATQAAYASYFAARKIAPAHGMVVPLGVEEAFRAGSDGPKLESRDPYFVVIGTTEARKNLSFLLEVWKQWSQSGGLPSARLVVVGRRGMPGESALGLLDRSTALAPSVVEVAELTDAPLAMLLRGARALLTPSLIEGFGIPVAEALAVGIPVIASDIQAHREVGGEFAEYIGPLDGPSWTAALDAHARPNSSRWAAARLRIRGFRAMSWTEHFEVVEAILGEQY